MSVFESLPAAFDTPRLMLTLPSTVGVPLMTPVLALNEAHEGSAPVVNVRGAVPLAVTVYENAVPTVPSALSDEVMSGRVRIEMTRFFVSAPPAFSARSATVTVPSAVGVPESTPPANEAHAGTPVAVKVMEPEPLAVVV